MNFRNLTDLNKTFKSRKILEKNNIYGVVFFNLRPNRNIEVMKN